jgi:hypothetical protein
VIGARHRRVEKGREAEVIAEQVISAAAKEPDLIVGSQVEAVACGASP